MKNILISLSLFLAALLSFPVSSQAQFEVGIGYLNSSPSGVMGNYIDRAGHGVSTDLAYRIPRTKLSVGVQFALSNYGYEKREDNYRFDNGYEGNVDVKIYNEFTNNSAYLRYDFMKEAFAQPYLLFGGGLSNFSTELTILDPREQFTSDCPKPLESATLLRDRTSYLMMGGGLRFDMSYPFKSLQRRKFLFDLRLSYLNGGEVSYMNLNGPNNNTVTYRGENVFFDFTSAAQPEVIHEYHAGSAFRTRMQFVTVNASIFYVLGNSKGGLSEFFNGL